MKPTGFTRLATPVFEHSRARGLTGLKVSLMQAGCVLGNIMLLIGGDDSVEIGFNSSPAPLSSLAMMPLTEDNPEGKHL